jgi:hypothetical protein
LIALLLFLVIGKTPIVRAGGLSLVIIGVIATLRRLGAVLAIFGGLTLTVSPAFWSQTGGGDSGPATIVIALIVAGVATALIVWVSRYPQIGLGLGISVFVLLLLSQVGTPRSLRLTSLLSAWLLYLLINMLRLTNPRPEEPPPGQPIVLHVVGILLLFAVGVINDPLFSLFAPAIMLSLVLSKTPFPRWYWAIMLLMIGIGFRGLLVEYLDPMAPLIVFAGWKNPAHWIDMINLVVGQFSIVGVILGVIGLSRLARWHAALGIVLMVAYGAYFLFGLAYTGHGREALLLPLLIIQIIWIIYALNAFRQWLRKGAMTGRPTSSE